MGGRDDRAGRGEAADRGGWGDVGAREEGVGSDGSRRGERNQGRGKKKLLSAATAFLICYLYLHLPLFSLLPSPLHLSFTGRRGTNNKSVFLIN